MGVLDGIDLDKLCDVRQQELVDNLELVVGRSNRDQRGHGC